MKIDKYLRVSKHSQTLLINQASLTRVANNETVYKFGFGQSPFPVQDQIVKALADAAHRKEYMNVQGDLTLREAIVDFHQKTENKNWRPENIIVGAGSKILLFCVMAAFEKAEILLPSPSWVSYEPQGKLAGHKVTWLPTNFEDKWHLTPKQLDDYCNNRADPNLPIIMVFNYPSNPTGQTYTKIQLAALALVMKKHHIIVIADEIYSLLTFEGSFASLDSYYPEGCIVSSGLSKWCGAGGWRLGFMHIPPQLKNLLSTVIGVASETYSCAPAPIQVAAITAYNNNNVTSEYIKNQKLLLNQISQYCSTALQKIGVKVHAAEGGFYLFPDFVHFIEKLSQRGITTSEQFTLAIMAETGVALLPGSAFGMPSKSLTTRLAFVDFDGNQIFNKQNTDHTFDKVKAGIQALCIWLTSL